MMRTAVLVCAALSIAAGAMRLQTGDLGIFTNESSVGQTPPGVKAHYDAAMGEYRITGGGENVWGTTDAFYFVWKKASGNLSLTADVQFVGTSAAEHRKAMLMVRQSLDPGSAYADAVSHGNGLTSLQFRGNRASRRMKFSRRFRNRRASGLCGMGMRSRCMPASRMRN